MPIGIDTCTSTTISGIRSDFLGELSPVSHTILRGVSGDLPVVAKGTVVFTVIDDFGRKQDIKVHDAHYVPRLPLRLLSPQQWSAQGPRLPNGKFARYETTDGTRTTLHFPGSSITVAHDLSTNLPLLSTSPGYSEFSRFVTTSSLSTTEAARFPILGQTIETLHASTAFEGIRSAPIDGDFLLPPDLPPPDLPASRDKAKQDLLLKWHFRLGHLPFSVLQNMAKHNLLPHALHSIVPPMCASCQYGKQSRTAWRTKSNKKSRQLRLTLRTAHAPGDVVSVDTLSSGKVPGLVAQSKGRSTNHRFYYATVFVDHSSGLDYVHLHEHNTGAAILDAKLAFERFSYSHGVTIKHYHCDNGRFAESSFRDSCIASNQSVSFCGVNAHHQNGIAERRIKDLRESARSMLLLAKHNWPTAITENLWPFALRHASLIRRNSARTTAHSPLGLFAGVTSVTPNLSSFHTFGCPTYVLDNALQQQHSQKTQWTERSRVGVYLGHSPDHASSVALILNIDTGHVSPQFHIKPDDAFATVSHNPLLQTPSKWQDITGIVSEQRRNTSKLDSPSDFLAKSRLPFDLPASAPLTSPPAHSLASASDPVTLPIPPVHGFALPPKPTTANPSPPPSKPPDLPPPQNHGVLPMATDPHAFTLPLRLPLQREPAASLQREPSTTRPHSNIRLDHNNFGLSASPNVHFDSTDSTLHSRPQPQFLYTTQTPPHIESDTSQPESHLPSGPAPRTFRSVVMRSMHATLLVSDHADIHPFTFAASLADDDTMYLHQARREPDWPEFSKAMIAELTAHTQREHWTVIPLSAVPDGHKVMKSVWSMKRKRKVATGEVYKWKARLCVDGSSQQHGINYWDTYAPTVQWETLRTLLTLALANNWTTRQLDFVLAFPQADVECPMYMDIPRGCHIDGNNKDHVLQLNKNLYGSKQAGKVWYNFLVQGLKKRGFQKSKADDCVFYKGSTIFVVYVDDAILLGPDPTSINSIVASLQEDFELTDEGDLSEYLGIQIARDGPSITLTQPTLINRILQTVGMINPSRQPAPTPATRVLHRDNDGPPRRHSWDYRSVIGMLNFLTRSTRPDLCFAVSQAARFMSNPRKTHEDAIFRICHYLSGTRDKGMSMTIDPTRGLEVFADADFCGGYSIDHTHDPDTAKSRSSYFITYQGCLIYWSSKLQTEVTLSTTEAEYVCLSQSLRTTLTLMRFFNELQKRIPTMSRAKPVVHCTAFEDNMGAIELSKAPKMKPRTKHINIKYHHFRTHVGTTLTISKIATADQLADIGTKPLCPAMFTKLRYRLIGW